WGDDGGAGAPPADPPPPGAGGGSVVTLASPAPSSSEHLRLYAKTAHTRQRYVRLGSRLGTVQARLSRSTWSTAAGASCSRTNQKTSSPECVQVSVIMPGEFGKATTLVGFSSSSAATGEAPSRSTQPRAASTTAARRRKVVTGDARSMISSRATGLLGAPRARGAPSRLPDLRLP